MPLEHHPLSREFPEYRQQLQTLHAEDAHFARLAQQYESLDKRIYEVEDGRESLNDLALHALKNERVALKDQIAECLRKANGKGG
ncbi:GTP-binding protein [Pseudomonas alcaligenes]|uniref:GTP-binding protein n=1 Tax=Aquipseudomonas alcaligenes TaxID=43263 RepID=A0ABR7S3Z0_AQUAC|nr:YdcH family protein [Pseudomonas alcaligenes]MBC9252280.1 GTP-binding protein [Pseudomonas alcaligenes]